MPTATYGPIAGKYGRVSANSTVTNLSEHELRPGADDLDTTHFESDATTTPPAVWEEGLVGVLGTDMMIRGKYDGFNLPHKSPILMFPGYFGSVYLGLTKTHGFTAGYRCLQTPMGTAVRGVAGFEARLKSNGAITLPTTNAA